MRKIKITAELIPAEEGGYIIYCPKLDITTEGETVDEAVAMLKDAASGYIEVIGIENSLKSLKDIRSRNWNL
ncbi:MAG: type II toxin-antitoxin system HicB family antitoxin [Candidatus Scalindua sp.]